MLNAGCDIKVSPRKVAANTGKVLVAASRGKVPVAANTGKVPVAAISFPSFSKGGVGVACQKMFDRFRKLWLGPCFTYHPRPLLWKRRGVVTPALTSSYSRAGGSRGKVPVAASTGNVPVAAICFPSFGKGGVGVVCQKMFDRFRKLMLGPCFTYHPRPLLWKRKGVVTPALTSSYSRADGITENVPVAASTEKVPVAAITGKVPVAANTGKVPVAANTRNVHVAAICFPSFGKGGE